ncbi:hypothetical protein AS188_10430 [Kocuria flava]|uniref:Uncharacterized protein n=2 Tax=Kocuria flava TaxID=446860 RepID=A0A0U3HG10_9MICC|nr:hypothetical protein [Kocuria flava]ALU40089.1 hypothetical protein AS188_10430 [Kocuria flava]
MSMGNHDSGKMIIGDPPNYPTMMRVATIAGVLGALGLGFVSAFLGGPEWLGFAVLGFYIVGGLPSYMYLAALVKENRRKGV